MIHGIGSTYQNNFGRAGWQDILEEAGRTVHPVELPGHGRNRAIAGPVPEVAESIIDVARSYGSVDAIGFSAGGYALLVAASRQPELFAAAAFLGVSDAGMQENHDGSAGMQEIADALLAEDEGPYGMPRMLRRLCEVAGNDRAAVAAYALSEQPSPSLAQLQRVQARCLVVEGGADLTGPAIEVAAALPRAQRVIVNGADHFSLPSDVRCIEAVMTFLE
jgi:pimeloyl-ACP methyl ester carboxylesterase